MEQHPIPQNVTTFQFRLIGDMTIKQFGYLASGAVLAYIFYKLPLPFIFTWPMAVLCAVGGFGLAFIPVEERPMDVWVLSFFKNVYSPTMFIWQKTKAAASPPQEVPSPAAVKQTPGAAQTPPVSLEPSRRTPGAIPMTTPRSYPQAPAVAAVAPLPTGTHQRARATIQQLFTPTPKTQAQNTQAPTTKQAQAAPAGVKKQGVMQMLQSLLFPQKNLQAPPRAYPSISPGDILQQRITATQGITRTANAAATPQQDVVLLEQKIHSLQDELVGRVNTQEHIAELKKQLADALAQKNTMEQELVVLRQKATVPPAPAVKTPPPWPPAPAVVFTKPAVSVPSPAPRAVVSPPAPTRPPMTKPPGDTVKVITPETAVKAGLPKLTTFANVVTGIIKDNTGNLLPGILVTVKDKDGMPLRALKTSKVGQFAASTPLPNGVYFVEAEDPRMRYNFDRAQITLNGSVLPALEIIAKSQRELSRDTLAKQIFGNQKI